MTPFDVKSYLQSFFSFEDHMDQFNALHFKLERVKHLLELIGNPHKEFKCIHIAGTKGKGSTCAFIASILHASGYRVGLYTSPHIYEMNERIRVIEPNEDCLELGGQIKETELRALVKSVKKDIEKVRNDTTLGRLTFYEVYTAIAFLYFQKRDVDFAVIETGLGGRLDATNVIDSWVAGITPISMEHTQQLGDSLSKIAVEKSAIIDEKTKHVVIAPQNPEALEKILNRCYQFKIQPTVIEEDLNYHVIKRDVFRQVFEVEGVSRVYDNLQSRLIGDHQVENAAVAIDIAEWLADQGYRVTYESIEEGIKQAAWPGRFEVYQKDPLIVLDCAHNPASAEALIETVKEFIPNKKVHLIVGVSKDKDIKGICSVLNEIAHSVILTKANHPRSHQLTDDELGCFTDKDVFEAANVDEAMSFALNKADKEDVILVTGSVFVVSEARRQMGSICINTSL